MSTAVKFLCTPVEIIVRETVEKREAGYHVITANSASQALEVLNSYDVNLVLSDQLTTHDVDVFVKSHHVGFDVVWIVECKHWARAVTKLHVLALREIVADLGADRGILLSESGFQSGAVEAATLTNVHVTSLANLRNTASTEITGSGPKLGRWVIPQFR